MRRLAAFGILTALLVPVVPAGASQERLPRLKCGSAKRVPVAVRKTAKVGDYFIRPDLRVRPDACITWKWSAANSDTHDVKLRTGPRGVRRFHSSLASTDYSFSAYLVKKGTYRVYCTLHPNSMHERIVVR